MANVYFRYVTRHHLHLAALKWDVLDAVSYPDLYTHIFNIAA